MSSLRLAVMVFRPSKAAALECRVLAVVDSVGCGCLLPDEYVGTFAADSGRWLLYCLSAECGYWTVRVVLSDLHETVAERMAFLARYVAVRTFRLWWLSLDAAQLASAAVFEFGASRGGGLSPEA